MPWHAPIGPLLMALALALGLAACGGGEESASPTVTGTPAAVVSPFPNVTLPPLSFSPTATPPNRARVIDLATSPPAVTIFAADKGDLRHDIPSMAVGDFNDDGLGDLLIGARFGDGPDNQQEDMGEAYVIFGRRELPATIDIAKGEQDITIYGEKPGDSLGMGVAALDFNDDGVDDIVVSSPMSDGILDPDYRTDRGAVYIIFGRKDLPKTIDIANVEGPQDVTVIAAEGFSLMGDSLITGDVNGDGISDLIMGAPFAGREPGAPHGGPRTELGEVYAVFGSKNPESLVHIPERQEDFTVVGPEQYAELGDAMAAGDVNGDGIEDMIITGEATDWPDRANVGVVYVVYGAEDLGGLRELAKNQQDVTIVGRYADDALGFCATSGDVNDDGIDDILLVAQRGEGFGERNTSGEADLIFGSSKLKDTIDVLKSEQDVTIAGADAHDLLTSCSAGHDVNGDGVNDILLGTGFAAPDLSRDGVGEAYVIFGRKDLPASVDLATDADVLLIGIEPRDRLGSAVSAGDLNGDGKEELLLTAPDAGGPDNSRPEAGEIYIVTSLQQGE